MRRWAWWRAWRERRATRRFIRWSAERQADFVRERAAARAEYLAWLEQRVLPGSPATGVKGGGVDE